MERENFEDKIKSAFNEAEVSPSDNVWNNIELDLTKADGDIMKRRLAFFQMLAAASVIFALTVGGMSLYFLNGKMNVSTNLQKITLKNSENQPLEIIEGNGAEEDTPIKSKSDKNSDLADNASPIAESSEVPSETKKLSQSFYKKARIPAIEKISIATPTNESEILFEADFSDAGLQLDKNRLSGLIPSRKIELKFTKENVPSDPVEIMLAKLKKREMELQLEGKEKDKKSGGKENLWTSVGFSAGSFNSVNQSTAVASSSTFSANASTVNKEANASGIAYSMGVNMGTKLADRWVVQGGLNYLTQTSDYTAQAAVGNADYQGFRPASINELDKINSADGKAETRVVTTAPYNVNNNVRYLSLPVQAGYLVLDKKFGVQVNAGVSTDLFLHNNKTAEGADLDKIDQGRGEDSPYKSMNFSGLVGTEISYRFGDRYRLALNPGVRYPFSSVYKTNLGIQSTPLTFDVGLRFRYIFH